MKLPAPPLPDWIERQCPFERYGIDVGGLVMHVMEVGEGPTVLALHGNPTWGYLYRHIALGLGGGFRVVMPDLIGLGLSERPPSTGDHTLRNHVGWMGALVDALDLEDLILVCQDWGGAIGMGALATRPERLAGLVVLNTVLGPPRPGFRSTWFHRLSRLPLLSQALFRVLGFPQRWLWIAQGDRASIRGEVARSYLWPLGRPRGNSAVLALARMVPNTLEHPSISPLEEVQAFVEAFDGPTAMVWGERDPVLGRLRRRICRALPQAHVQVTDGGHFIQEEESEAIVEAVRRVGRECATGVFFDEKPPHGEGRG